jgi:glycosyltransferase involved in cell wall biosynthesis
LAVTNDLVVDQRLHKVCMTLMAAGYAPLLVGRLRRQSPPLGPRAYATHRMPMWFERGKFFYLEYNLRLLLFLLRTPASIITANDLDTLLACRLAAWWRGAGLVYDSHEYFTGVVELAHRPLTRGVWAWLERRLVPGLRAMSTVNEPIARLYGQQYGVSVAVVANLPMQRTPPPAVAKPPILIYQGQLKPGRGLAWAIGALVHLPAAVQLWVIGDGVSRPGLEALARELGVAQRVRFWGQLPFEALPAITRQARVGLSIEEPLSQNLEQSAPNKLYDYLQDGLPVVVADLPAHRAAVEAWGVGAVVQGRTPQDLAAAAAPLLLDDRLYGATLPRVAEAARHLCWEGQAQTLLALYEAAKPQS